MTAILKVYTDSGHTSEVAHTANYSTTLNNGGTLSSGSQTVPVASTTGWPSSGYVDIDTGGNLETLLYISISGNTLTLAAPTALSHANGVAVTQWFYLLAVGDQVIGVANDGTNSTPVAGNTATWYLYNAGDQTAQSITLSTSNASPSTIDGYADTLISITGSSSGFATSVSPSNMASGATQQIWIVEQVPRGQAISNSPNPQLCLLNIAMQTI